MGKIWRAASLTWIIPNKSSKIQKLTLLYKVNFPQNPETCIVYIHPPFILAALYFHTVTEAQIDPNMSIFVVKKKTMHTPHRKAFVDTNVHFTYFFAVRLCRCIVNPDAQCKKRKWMHSWRKGEQSSLLCNDWGHKHLLDAPGLFPLIRWLSLPSLQAKRGEK